jgi:hypothetical protein
MKCNCCSLDLEILDEVPLCHYCYLRECQANLGKCGNAQLNIGGNK